MKLTINGKEYGLSWGMGCLRIFCDEMGCDLDPALQMIMGAGDYTVLERSKSVVMAVWAAAKNAAYLERKTDFDLTFFDVENYRDNTPEAEFKKITDDFLSSMLQGRTVAERFGIAVTSGEAQAKKKSRSPNKSS